jgi:hypothetical protein
MKCQIPAEYAEFGSIPDPITSHYFESSLSSDQCFKKVNSVGVTPSF